MHTCGSLRGSVTGVVDLWILTVPLSPGLGAGAAPARDPAKAIVKMTATTVTPVRKVSLVRQVMVVMKNTLDAGETGIQTKRRRPANCYTGPVPLPHWPLRPRWMMPVEALRGRWSYPLR